MPVEYLLRFTSSRRQSMVYLCNSDLLYLFLCSSPWQHYDKTAIAIAIKISDKWAMGSSH